MNGAQQTENTMYSVVTLYKNNVQTTANFETKKKATQYAQMILNFENVVRLTILVAEKA